jgi:hypothetical protein
MLTSYELAVSVVTLRMGVLKVTAAILQHYTMQFIQNPKHTDSSTNQAPYFKNCKRITPAAHM